MFKEQVDINMVKSFSGATIIPVRKVLQKGNTHILSLIIFYDNRRKKLQGIEFNSLLYRGQLFLCWLSVLSQTKLRDTSKGQEFENRTYNYVSGIVIPELLMNIFECHGFLSNTKSAVILSSCSKLIYFYIQQCFVLYENNSNDFIAKHRSKIPPIKGPRLRK